MKNLLISIVTGICLCSSIVLANTEQNFLTTTIQGEKRVIELKLVLDDAFDIIAIKMDDIQNGRLFESSKFPTQNVENGIVLFSAKGKEVLKLLSQNFTPVYGGLIRMNYLFNGLRGTRRNIEFDLVRAGDTWSVFQKGKAVRGFHIIKNRIRFIGEVGIKQIITKFK